MSDEIPFPEESDEQTDFDAFRREALFIVDTEVYRRIGVSEKVGRVAVRELEKRQVFPAKDHEFTWLNFYFDNAPYSRKA
ncbi:MAG: hypothetical protein QOJ84_2392 [Bradyrhizobium sp.]|jgi:hypothetical protein|nr:hypothetical protein [Bradyrhizobium sp.]